MIEKPYGQVGAARQDMKCVDWFTFPREINVCIVLTFPVVRLQCLAMTSCAVFCETHCDRCCAVLCCAIACLCVFRVLSLRV